MCLISVYFEDADLYAESYLVVNNKIHVSLSVRTCLTNGTHRHSLSFIFLCKKWPSGPPARLRPEGDYAPEGRAYASESRYSLLNMDRL